MVGGGAGGERVPPAPLGWYCICSVIHVWEISIYIKCYVCPSVCLCVTLLFVPQGTNNLFFSGGQTFLINLGGGGQTFLTHKGGQTF